MKKTMISIFFITIHAVSFNFMIGYMKDMLFFLFIKIISDNGGFHSNQDGIAVGYSISGL